MSMLSPLLSLGWLLDDKVSLLRRVTGSLIVLPAPRHCYHSHHAIESSLQSDCTITIIVTTVASCIMAITSLLSYHCCCITAVASLPLHHWCYVVVGHWCMCHHATTIVTSNYVILATLMPSCHHFNIATAMSLPLVICCSLMLSLLLLCCCCAVNQSSSWTSSLLVVALLLGCQSMFIIDIVIDIIIVIVIIIVALSLCHPYPYHGQIVTITSSQSTDVAGTKKQHHSQGSSCSLPFLSSDGSSYVLCCVNACQYWHHL